jgi:hypothetical protein
VEFDEIISLGGSCAPAYQARKNYGSLPPMPFDWWTLKLPEVVPVIKNGLNDLFDDDIVQYGEYINRPVLFSRFAIHVHDLSEDIMHDKLGRWRNHLKELRSRYSFLGRQLNERASQGNILFVRSWIGEDDYLRDKMFDLTVELIMTLRGNYDNDNIRLLMVDYDLPMLSTIDGVLEDNVTIYNRTDMGCDRGWQEMFRRQGIVRRNRSEFPSEQKTIT